MVTDFQERLRQIREAKDRESREQKELAAAANHERLVAIERRFDRREQIERVIESLAEKFMTEVAGFTRSKSFFEGKYKIEISSDDLAVGEHGALLKHFSRMAFLIDTTRAGGPISVACKKTIRSRDHESTTTQVDVPSTSIEEFERFVQAQFLEFADLYFSTHSAPTSR